jgi:hypothetical protein
MLLGLSLLCVTPAAKRSILEGYGHKVVPVSQETCLGLSPSPRYSSILSSRTFLLILPSLSCVSHLHVSVIWRIIPLPETACHLVHFYSGPVCRGLVLFGMDIVLLLLLDKHFHSYQLWHLSVDLAMKIGQCACALNATLCASGMLGCRVPGPLA